MSTCAKRPPVRAIWQAGARAQGGRGRFSVIAWRSMRRASGVAVALVAALGGVAWPWAAAGAGAATVGVAFHVAHAGAGAGAAATPVLERAALEAMLARASALLGVAGLCFERAGTDALAPDTHLDLVTRADRHALADAAARPHGVVEVFVVRSLADVDVHGGVLAGVHWRWAGKGKEHAGRRWVILSATGAGEDTLAHELGHWLGLGHATAPENLMTPASRRTGTALTPAQRARIRAVLAAALKRGELAPGKECAPAPAPI